MTDLLPTLAAAAGEPDVVDRLKRALRMAVANYKLHLDGYDQTALFTGKSEQSARNFVFYYDETVLTAIRYKQFKITFSAKFGDRWDSPLQSYGRPLITNLLMDPFERQTGDVNRQYAGAQDLGADPDHRYRGPASRDLQGISDPPARHERRRRKDPGGRSVANSEASAGQLRLVN